MIVSRLQRNAVLPAKPLFVFVRHHRSALGLSNLGSVVVAFFTYLGTVLCVSMLIASSEFFSREKR